MVGMTIVGRFGKCVHCKKKTSQVGKTIVTCSACQMSMLQNCCMGRRTKTGRMIKNVTILPNNLCLESNRQQHRASHCHAPVTATVTDNNTTRPTTSNNGRISITHPNLTDSKFCLNCPSTTGNRKDRLEEVHYQYKKLDPEINLQYEERARQAKFVTIEDLTEEEKNRREQAIEKDERNYPIAQVEIRIGHRSYVQRQRKDHTEPAAPCYHRTRYSSPGRPGAATWGMDTSQSMTGNISGLKRGGPLCPQPPQ
ncbi:hypothetical protein Bbelb_425440 [Branchiostoma belcheri]|nr:hypothetical protein Bbelb_425440 [Branchiostoma belcheri]